MKALSVVEPWGDMIANRKKTLELRSWKPEITPMRDVALVQNSIRLTAAGQEDPNGYVVAIIDIINCKPWVQSDSELAGCHESEFENGWLAWEIANVRKMERPVKVIAKRKLYELSSSEEKAIACAVHVE